MKRCAIYARVSTAERMGTNVGLYRQLTELRAAGQARGYLLSPDLEFIDDGYSGTDLERPALNRLRNAATMERADVALMYAPDRLARKLGDQLILAKHFEKASVPLEFVTTWGVAK
jgi:site-specific DNA recombinase